MNSDALVSMAAVSRTLRTMGLFILDVLAAILVPAILVGSVGKLPLIRSISYSAGASLSSRTLKPLTSLSASGNDLKTAADDDIPNS